MNITLSDIWFVLFVVVIGGYLILDGFDMGVGILHLPFAHNDMERRTLLNSIGPVWDGNEVWLILGGGVLFAAFPFVYASLFSGFYLAMMAVLLVLILRTVAIEFRSKRPSPRWRTTWDVVFALSSAVLALLLGVAFGNVVVGVPLDAQGNISMSLLGLLTPIPLLIGLTTVAMFAMHGSLYLSMKTGDDLQARVKAWLPRLIGVFFVLNTLLIAALVVLHPAILDRYTANPWLVIFPAAALLAIVAAWYLLRTGHAFWAFVASSLMIFLLLVSASAGIFPNLLISTTDQAFNLTIYNAASEDNTLTVMLIIALIGLPFVLLYTAGVYYFFRGKVVVEPTTGY
jgi:cytochrome d ubiquinol oxidase subunit II